MAAETLEKPAILNQEVPQQEVPYDVAFAGLHTRLLLGEVALNPNNRNLEQVRREILTEKNIDQRDYSPFEEGSRRQRGAYWEGKGEFDAQKQAWIAGTVKTFQDGKTFFTESERGKHWVEVFSRLGINVTEFTTDQAELLYQKYLSGSVKDQKSKQFVKDIISSPNYNHSDLEAVSWIGNIFGTNPQNPNVAGANELIRDYVFAEKQVQINPDAMVTSANQNIEFRNDQGQTQQFSRVNFLIPEEIRELNFFQPSEARFQPQAQKPAEEAPVTPQPTLPPPQEPPNQPDGRPTQPYTPEVPDHPDWEKLRQNTMRFNEATWKNATDIRHIVAPSEVVKKGLPVYYPGSGRDISYPLAFSDAENFVFVDYKYINDDRTLWENWVPDQEIEEIGGRVRSVTSEGTMGSGGKRVITFDWGGKERKITLYAEDATSFVPDELKDGSAMVVIIAPTPNPRGQDMEAAPGYIMTPENVSPIYQTVTTGGFIHQEPTIILPSDTLGFRKVLDTPPYEGEFDAYKNGYPLYQKIYNESQLKNLLILDQDVSNSVLIREGIFTQVIDRDTLRHFEEQIREVRTNFDQLTEEKRQEVLRALQPHLLPETISQKQMETIMHIGKGFGLTDEAKVKEYIEKANQVVRSVFPEFEVPAEMSPPSQEVIPAVNLGENIRAADQFIRVLRDPTKFTAVSGDPGVMRHELGCRLKLPLEESWFYVNDTLDMARDRYKMPMALYVPTNHAMLVLKTPQQSPDGTWKMLVYNPFNAGEEEITLPSYDPANPLGSFIHTNSYSLPQFRDNTYDLSVSNNPELVKYQKMFTEGKLAALQQDGKNCLPYTLFVGALLNALKPGETEFKREGIPQFREDFGIRIKTLEEMLSGS